MKKFLIGAAAILIVLLIGFIWLLSGASVENAPKDIQTIELDAP